MRNSSTCIANDGDDDDEEEGGRQEDEENVFVLHGKVYTHRCRCLPCRIDVVVSG